MKSISLALAFVLMLGGAFAQVPSTPNIHLQEPPYHYQRWDIPNNANWTTLDSFWTLILSGCGGDGSHGIGWDPVLHFTCVGITGTSAPGGTNGQHQYNNSGALGGFNDGTAHQVLHGLRTFGAVTSLDTDSTIAQTGVDINTSFQVTSLHLSAPCSIAMGCTGTATPGLIGGTNITITGSWPNQTVTSSAGGPGGSNTQVEFNDSGTHGGNSALTFNKTTGITQATGVLTKTAPFADPNAFGATGTNNSALDTAGWTAALASGATTICPAGRNYTLNSIALASEANIQGTNDGFVGGCDVTPGASGVAFKSAAGLGIINEVKISGIHFTGGVNPIDIIQVNGFYAYHLTFSNYTGNAITIVQGERHIFEDITTQHTGANAFSTFAFADCTKTVFTTGCAAAFPTADVDRQTITSVHNLGNILGGFSSQWFLWNGNVQGATVAGNMTCFFSCSTGIIHVANVLENGDWVGPVVDNVGTAGSPEPIGFDIHACFNTRIASYNPGFGANNMTTQMYIDQAYGCTIANSQFSSTVDNATTFAIKHGNTFNKQDLTLLNVTGGYFDMNSISAFKVKIIGGIVTPNNALGGQTLSDETNGGIFFNMMADSNGSAAATSIFGVHRAVGSFGYLNDFQTNGTHFDVGIPFRPKQLAVANLPAAGGNAGSWMVVTDSTAIAAEGQVCAGGGTAVVAAFSTGFTWKCF